MNLKNIKIPYLYLYLIACLFIGIYLSVALAIILTLSGLVFSVLKWMDDASNSRFDFDDELYEWPGTGEFAVQVFHDKTDKNIPGVENVVGAEWMKQNEVYDCLLLPEEESSAIIVFVNKIPVGCLDNDTARSFRRRLGSKKLTGFTTTSKIKIKNKTKKSYDLWLDIKPFKNQKK